MAVKQSRKSNKQTQRGEINSDCDQDTPVHEPFLEENETANHQILAEMENSNMKVLHSQVMALTNESISSYSTQVSDGEISDKMMTLRYEVFDWINNFFEDVKLDQGAASVLLTAEVLRLAESKQIEPATVILEGVVWQQLSTLFLLRNYFGLPGSQDAVTSALNLVKDLKLHEPDLEQGDKEDLRHIFRLLQNHANEELDNALSFYREHICGYIKEILVDLVQTKLSEEQLSELDSVVDSALELATILWQQDATYFLGMPFKQHEDAKECFNSNTMYSVRGEEVAEALEGRPVDWFCAPSLFKQTKMNDFKKAKERIVIVKAKVFCASAEGACCTG